MINFVYIFNFRHEMADVAGLTTQAFGKDEVDR